MSAGLGREDIRALLDDLSAELAARGARAELFLVGGAALAVAYDATRATRDLDAVFIPADVVRQAAAAVAEHRGPAALKCRTPPQRATSPRPEGRLNSFSTAATSITGLRGTVPAAPAPSCAPPLAKNSSIVHPDLRR